MSRTWMKALVATTVIAGSAMLSGVPAQAAGGTVVVTRPLSTNGFWVMVSAEGSTANGIDINRSAGNTVTVSDTLTPVVAGDGCQQLGAVVRCSAVDVTHLHIVAGGGDDAVRNNTDINSTIYGGDGADRLFGGSVHDYISGNTGTDIVNGGGGSDTCIGETLSNCEQ
ncbi:hypothetical protein J5X84_20065 [Streptosporangiaceae bacterium NEAU-GS5]|nr:hypothetical protein [Streptosporangiaceae bacterium NEAU-GS5]